MKSLHLPLLNGILLILTLAGLARCVPPPSIQARFNCPDVPPPLGFRQAAHPTLYRFCISRQLACDCYESPHPTFPLRYHPICDIEAHTDRNDHELLTAIRYCQDTCMCYGGPRENWSRWPFGPEHIGPRISPTQLQNGYGATH